MSTNSTMSARIHRKGFRIPSKRQPGKGLPGKLHTITRVSKYICFQKLYKIGFGKYKVYVLIYTIYHMKRRRGSPDTKLVRNCSK